MTHHIPKTILRALSSLGLMLVLVVGLPLFFYSMVGPPDRWRLPSAAAVIDGFSTAARGERSIAVVLAWIAVAIWIQVVISCGFAVRAWRDRENQRSVRWLGPMYRWVTGLVASVTALAPALGSAGAATPAGDFAATPKTPSSAAVSIRLDVSPIPETPPAHLHEVVAGDSLWGIAEQYFGDGFRWVEIAEHNDGRSQPGGAFSARAAHISPGWTLEIPTGIQRDTSAVPLGEAENAPRSVESLVEVAPGDTLWDLAEQHFGDGSEWTRIHGLNRGRPQPDGERLEDPSLILPGWKLDLVEHVSGDGSGAPAMPELGMGSAAEPEHPPAIDSEAASRDAKPSALEEPASISPMEIARTEGFDQDPAAQDVGERADDDRGLLGISALFGTTAALGLVAQRRRRRNRLESPGQPLYVPGASGPNLLVSENADDPSGLAEFQRIRHRLPSDAGFRALRWDGTRVFGGPDVTKPESMGSTWTWEPLGIQGHTIATAPAAWVSCGYDSGALVLMDLAWGAVALIGSPREVRAHAGHMLLEIDGGGEVPSAEVLLLGDLPVAIAADLGLRSRVRVAHGTEEVSGYLGAVHRDLSSDQRTLPMESSNSVQRPLVVVASAEMPGIEGLVEECTGVSGLGFLILGPLPDLPHLRTIERSGAKVHLADIGILIDTLHLEHLEALVEYAADDKHDLEVEVDNAVFPVSLPSGAILGTNPAEPDSTEEVVLLRLLGTPTVVGDVAGLRDRHVECLVYLAMHPNPKSMSVKTALWPSRAPSESRWSSFLSELRSGLGVTRGGDLVFPHLRGGELRLSIPVRTDVDELIRAYEACRGEVETPGFNLERLLDVLESMAGPPLLASHGYEWAAAEGTLAFIERVIGEASHLLADQFLLAGRFELAGRAIEAGLRAIPGTELLYRDRMRLEHARGDRVAVDRAFRELVEMLDCDAFGSLPHPQTVSLRNELLGAE
jgi:hypothetical protein